MATEPTEGVKDHMPRTSAQDATDVAPARVQRYGRGARWFHAAVYLGMLVLLVTGWWLLSGHEGRPSVLARLFELPDTTLHKRAGWVFVAVVGAVGVLGIRAIPRFFAESLRFRRGDLRWFVRWPQAVFTGRFARHEGRYDPGQRILNILLTLGLAILVGTGAALALLHGGPTFAVLDRIHRIATYPVTALIAGHLLVASGVLPGYRGVWRSMHLGGKLRADVAQRLWPAWRPLPTRRRWWSRPGTGGGTPPTET